MNGATLGGDALVASSQREALDFSVPSDLEEGGRDSEATRRDTEGDPRPSGTSSAGGCMTGGRTGPLAWVIPSPGLGQAGG